MELVELFRNVENQTISELKKDTKLYEIAVHKGIDAAGETLPFAVHPDASFMDMPTYWSNLKAEFRELVCNSNGKYSSVYKELQEAQKKIDTVLLPIITGAIAVYINLGVAVITPFVRLLVVAVAKLGKEAYCRQNGEIMNNTGEDIKLSK